MNFKNIVIEASVDKLSEAIKTGLEAASPFNEIVSVTQSTYTYQGCPYVIVVIIVKN